MSLTTDTRGVSEVVGAILLFGLLVAVLAILQTQAIPTANEEIEFNHNQDVQNDLIEFQEAASRTAAHGTTESVGIRAGTTYPSRLLFFNPPSPAGTVRTVEDDSVEISDADVQDIELTTESGDYDLPVEEGSPFDTARIEYEPIYNEYQNPPTTVLEYGLLYNDFGETQVVESPGSIISGTDINLVFYAGEMSRATSGSTTLETIPTSAPARTVSVEGELEITLPTRLSENEWDEALDGADRVDDIEVDGGDVEITLEDGTYDLRMARVGISSAVAPEDPEYVVLLDDAGAPTTQSSFEDGEQLQFELRDRYNNPVSGTELDFEFEDEDGETMSTAETTNTGGRVTVEAEASDPDNDVEKITVESEALDEDFVFGE